ncbi:MAG: hypothetical protein QOJ64_1836 [Acidobacteriota bacterium]|jgi:hypothetical protein|nr:hypothetical protein [Acidobacteriota bacterium]
MRTVVLLVLVIICCPGVHGQKQTPADPFGLATFGFENKLESRPLISPPVEPPQSRACGVGIYLREETFTVNNKPKKIKTVIAYFLPNPKTLSIFNDTDKMKPEPSQNSAQRLTNLPPGVSSLTFFWPPKLRSLQQVLLMRAENVDRGLIEKTMDFPAVLNVQEGDTASILWTFDAFIPGSPPPMLLGNFIASDPVLLRMYLPRGAKKCLEWK